MALIKPLDLQNILVNYFAGSMEIFIFIAMIFFGFMAAKFRMPNSIFLILMVLFVILMAGYGIQYLYTLAIFAIGLFVYYIVAKMIKS